MTGSANYEYSIYAQGGSASTPTPTPASTPASTPTPTPGGNTIGYTSVGSSDDGSGASDVNAFRFQAGSSFTVTTDESLSDKYSEREDQIGNLFRQQRFPRVFVNGYQPKLLIPLRDGYL